VCPVGYLKRNMIFTFDVFIDSTLEVVEFLFISKSPCLQEVNTATYCKQLFVRELVFLF